MKAQKKLSIFLSALLTLNLLYGGAGAFKVKAEEIPNTITIKNVSVNEKLLWLGETAEVTVEASASEGELADEASAVYLQTNGDIQIEKEVALVLQEGKYKAMIPITDESNCGSYKLSFITIGDKEGNVQIFYNSNIHGEFGLDLSGGDFMADNDTEGPKLSKITINPNTIYSDENSNIVIEAVDDKSGLADEANLVYVLTSGQQDIEKELSLKLEDGKYVGTLSGNDGFSAGKWMISYVVLADKQGNVRIIYNSIVHGLGENLSAGNLTVTVDREGPQLTGISIDRKVAYDNQKVKIAVEAFDASGLAKEATALYTDGTTEKEVTLSLVDGKYVGELTVDDGFAAGEWKVSYIAFEDLLGNASIVYNSVIHGVGKDLSPADLTVKIDNQGPELTSISIDKNVAYDNQKVKITVEASDETGLGKEATVLYTDGASEKPVILSLVDGKYVGELAVDEGFAAGEWKASYVAFEDSLGNASITYNSNIHGLGKDLSAADLIVKIDSQGPELTSISIDKNVAYDNQKVKITVVASDETGLGKEATVLYTDGASEKPVTLSLVDGKYVGELAVDEGFAAGEWKVSYVAFEDSLGNASITYNCNIHGLGKDLSAADLTVKIDSQGPELTSIGIDKNIANLGSKVQITVKASDVTGLGKEANLVYTDGASEKEITLGLAEGNYIGELVVDESFVSGLWKVSYVAMEDSLGNASIAYNKNVHAEYGIDLSAVDLYVDLVSPDKPVIAVDKDTWTNKDVQVTITAENGANIEYRLEGQESWLVYNGAFIVSVNTKVYAKATDTAGNVSVETVREITNIDKTAPIIQVKGVEDKGIYNVDVTPIITTSDNTAVTITQNLTLDGNAVAIGKLDKDGTYELRINAEDEAGNKSEAVISFVVDKTAPIIEVKGVEDKGLYNIDVTPVITITDITAIKVTKTLTLDGKAIEIGKLDKEGAYELKVTAEDEAGNKSEAVISFVVDKTAPVIQVSGVEDNKTYINTSVTPTITVDDSAATVTVKLDGIVYNRTDTIWSVGSHTLVITAIDKAGNKSEKTLTFKIEAVVTSNTDQTTLAQEIKDIVTNAKPGETVVVNAQEYPIVSQEIFKALKGVDKPVSFTLETQGMSLTWTFNGKDITDTNTSVDLTLNAEVPNREIIGKIDSNAEILSFKNHGELPAPMTVTIPVDTAKFDVTKPIYFYYYNETTKKVEQIGDALTAYKKGDSYYVDVTLNHTSDYFLSAFDNTTVSQKVQKLVQTGYAIDLNVLVGGGALLIAMGLVVLVVGVRRRRA